MPVAEVEDLGNPIGQIFIPLQRQYVFTPFCQARDLKSGFEFLPFPIRCSLVLYSENSIVRPNNSPS